MLDFLTIHRALRMMVWNRKTKISWELINCLLDEDLFLLFYVLTSHLGLDRNTKMRFYKIDPDNQRKISHGTPFDSVQNRMFEVNNRDRHEHGQ